MSAGRSGHHSINHHEPMGGDKEGDCEYEMAETESLAKFRKHAEGKKDKQSLYDVKQDCHRWSVMYAPVVRRRRIRQLFRQIAERLKERHVNKLVVLVFAARQAAIDRLASLLILKDGFRVRIGFDLVDIFCNSHKLALSNESIGRLVSTKARISGS